jgi:signal transduction histidine kinase
MLHEFVTANREELIARTRVRVAQRSSPRPTQRELSSGIPLFLDQLAAALSGGPPSKEVIHAIGETATIHGGHLLEQGYSVSQVVHDYGDVCQAVTELAQETDALITTEEFHILNRCLDDAIAQAVTEHTRRREDAIAQEGTMRSGVLAHELRNRLSAAVVGFQLIKRGSVAAGGSTSAMVSRNHERMNSLIQRSLLEVRLEAGITYRERVSVAALIEEADADGSLEAVARNLALTVTTDDDGADVQVDRQIVAGAIANLMQNAFKFTRPGGHVSLRTSVTEHRVLIDVEDECGGLAPGKAEELFGAFLLRGGDRSGLGLGLFISRKGVEANDGLLRVKDLPGHGCIFTIDLPRMTDLLKPVIAVPG